MSQSYTSTDTDSRGDGQPRQTDLSYEIPLEFDPYAIISDEELAASGAGGPSLASILGGTMPTTQSTTPIPEEVYDAVDLPDLQTHPADGTPPLVVSAKTVSASSNKSDPLGLEAFRIEGKDMTLEEIGKRRHQEWLASRGQAGVTW